MGPGLHPQYTRAQFSGGAVGGLSSPMMRRTERNPDMVAEQSSGPRPRDQSASQPVQHSVCRWSVQTLLMCAMRSKAMITSMSSSAQKHRVSGNTVAVQAGVQHGKDGRRRQGADNRDAGGTEQSQFQPSVRRLARIS